MNYEFETIYSEYFKKMQSYFLKLGCGEHASDLAQELFLKVSNSLSTFRGESKLSTWIYRIATNLYIDYCRSHSTKISMDSVPLDNLSEHSILFPSNKSIESDTEEQMIRKEMQECIVEYINTLNPTNKTIIFLSEFESFENKEIAAILGISLPNVKIRLNRARAELKEKFTVGCDFYQSDDGCLCCSRR